MEGREAEPHVTDRTGLVAEPLAEDAVGESEAGLPLIEATMFESCMCVPGPEAKEETVPRDVPGRTKEGRDMVEIFCSKELLAVGGTHQIVRLRLNLREWPVSIPSVYPKRCKVVAATPGR